jgi:hypothetical protein
MNNKSPSLSSPSNVAHNYRTKFEGVRWKSPSSSSVANCRLTSTASCHDFLWFFIARSLDRLNTSPRISFSNANRSPKLPQVPFVSRIEPDQDISRARKTPHRMFSFRNILSISMVHISIYHRNFSHWKLCDDNRTISTMIGFNIKIDRNVA